MRMLSHLEITLLLMGSEFVYCHLCPALVAKQTSFTQTTAQFRGISQAANIWLGHRN